MPLPVRTPVTRTLLILIGLMFMLEVVLGGPSIRRPAEWLMLDINGNALELLGALTGGTLFDRQWWRLITVMFLHANLPHVAVNSWALFQLGSLYEALFGSRRFLLIYLVTGLCASIASMLRIAGTDGASVGASGAIFGILGAFIFSIRRSQWRHEQWARGLTRQLVFWGILNLAIGASFKFIDNTAHIAGLVSGLILGLVLPHRMPPPPPNRDVIDVQPYDESPTSPIDNDPSSRA